MASSSSSCSSTTTRPEDRIGHLLAGHLELTGILGIGAYGVVYTAIDIYTYMSYAVKALSKEGMDARQRRFQQREIALHHRVSAHENIVSLIKILEAPDCTYVVIEYCPEGDLFTNITERGHFVGNDLLAKRVFLQLLDAVEHCHNMGIYHRDLKPENVLVCDGGYQVKLADFGLATTDAITSDFGCGSTFYMSPECQQQSGSKSYHRAMNCYASAPNDVWSLGVILVNLTCGRNPWKRAAPSDSTFRAYLKDPKFLRTILPLSAELDDVLRSIFELDPLKRITIRDLRTRIQHCHRFTTGPGPAMCTTPPPSDVSSDCSDISTSDAYELPPQQYLPQFQAQNGAITPSSPSTPAPYPQQDMFIFSGGQLPATPPLSPPLSPVEAQKPAQFAPPPTPVSNSSPQVVVSHPQLNTTSWQVTHPILDQVDKFRSHYFPQNPHLVTGPQGVPCY